MWYVMEIFNRKYFRLCSETWRDAYLDIILMHHNTTKTKPVPKVDCFLKYTVYAKLKCNIAIMLHSEGNHEERIVTSMMAEKYQNIYNL